MANGFNIKEGLLNTLKLALKDDGFIEAIFELLLGRKDAGRKAKGILRSLSMELTLNEMVAINRLLKRPINEGLLDGVGEKSKDAMREIFKIYHKTEQFKRRVVFKAIKKPGAFIALVRVIATEGADVKSDAILAKALIEAAIEVAEEENKTQVKAALSENVEQSYGGRKPVNVYVGRFQPFHLGHLSCLQKAAEYGLRTVICRVMKGSSASAKDHPFVAIEEEMFDRLKSAYPDLIADVIPVKNAFIEFWLYPARERGFEPITWTTGQDRVASYQSMVDKYMDKYELSHNFKVLPLDKNMDADGGSANNLSDISGTNVRKCLINDDREGFEKQMPECLWDMYDAMREALMGDTAQVQQSTASLSEEEMMRKRIDEAIERLVKGRK